jgi:uncharacterized membrane protein
MMYVCPMHPQVRQEHPGVCPLCGMALVKEEVTTKDAKTDENFLNTYRPLLTIVGLIALAAIAVTISAGRDWRDGMLNFMAGFFLVFSGLKLLDVPGFAKGYATYDLLAQRLAAYGYIYPFLELLLGIAYLTRTAEQSTTIATVALMTFSGIGVSVSLMRGQRFQCACLGTMIKVPLTKVTLIEDFGMAIMALVMIFTS